MQYLLLIYHDEKTWLERPQAEKESVYGEYRALLESIVKDGSFRAGDQLQPTSAATTVRVRDGKPLVTDGPFAEAREQLGGYFLVDAPDLDAALAVAKRIPSARMGAVEVRPIQPRSA